MNSTALTALEDTLVIQDGNNPVVVVLPYARYMALQERFNA